MEVNAQQRYEVTVTGQQLMALYRALDGARFEGLDAARLLLDTATALQAAKPVEESEAGHCCTRCQGAG